jgi:hypothetical protein
MTIFFPFATASAFACLPIFPATVWAGGFHTDQLQAFKIRQVPSESRLARETALCSFACREVLCHCLPKLFQHLFDITLAESNAAGAESHTRKAALAEPVVRGTGGDAQALRQFSNGEQSIHMGYPAGKSCKTTKATCYSLGL